jgi:hypothetical protein
MLKNKIALYAIAGAAGVASALISPPPAEAQVSAEIIDFTYAGNGCPGGSARGVWDDVNKTLTLSFDKFATTLPPGRSAACNLAFVVKLPAAFQISLDRIEYLGYIDTEPSVSGQLRRWYKYGANEPLQLVSDFPPGTRDDFHIVDDVPWGSVCTTQETVLMNTRIDLGGTPSPGGTSEMVVDAQQYNTKVVFYFNLLPC